MISAGDDQINTLAVGDVRATSPMMFILGCFLKDLHSAWDGAILLISFGLCLFSSSVFKNLLQTSLEWFQNGLYDVK